VAPGPGLRLGQRYELQSLIATGGMGQVWRGVDTTLDRPVAIKVLRSEFTGDATFLERFRAEARHTAALSHPNIAGIYDYGEAEAAAGQVGGTEHVAYLVMELVAGEPLSEVLAREGRLSPERTLDILGQAAAGLNVAHHAGVVHRDIKPGNLLVRPDGTVKITDFGIARAAHAVPLTQTGMVVGTAHYLSPEQAEGRVVTPASDVYSLGVVGFECLAGERPFDGSTSVAIALKQIREPPPPLPADIRAPVRELIQRAMDKDARRRFPTGGEFANAVAAVRAGRSIAPGPASGPTMRTQMIGAAAYEQSPARPQTQAFQAPAAAGPPPAPAPRPSAPAPARRSNAGWYLLLVVALLVLAGVIALAVAQNLNDSAPPTTPGSTSTSAEQTSAEQTSAEQTTTSESTSTETTTEETTTTTETTTTEPSEETIVLDVEQYRGRDIADVTADLEGQGFTVVEDPVPNDQFPDGVVITITPNGEVPVGSEITVRFVENGEGDGDGDSDG